MANKKAAKKLEDSSSAPRAKGILEGKVALVTGASGGIGRAIALRLAQEGAAVGIQYRTQAHEAAAVAEEIRSAGSVAKVVRADVSKPREVRAMVAKITAELGAPDILVNNAGLALLADLGNFDARQFARMRATNVDGVIHATRAVMEGMKKRGFGRIVNITSVAGIGTAFAGTTFYAATKAAVAVLTRRFAMELGPSGITVNSIAPGYILTGMNTRGKTPAEIEAARELMASKTMLRRVGAGEDIAAAVAFLASPAAGFVTAQSLTVDGGRMDYIGHG
jgi:3-oxoacyl-[acyl-carrier protein] reductase